MTRRPPLPERSYTMTRRTPIGQGVIEYHAPPGPETPGQRVERLIGEAFDEAFASPARAETIAHALIDRLEREGLLDRPSATQTAPGPADDADSHAAQNAPITEARRHSASPHFSARK